MIHVAREDSSPEACSLSPCPNPPHCQACISYEARLHRLNCGHVYCDQCRGRIVNCAFMDIEGLSDYPCPMCRTIRQLGGTVPEPQLCSNGQPTDSSSSTVQSSALMEVIREEEAEGSGT
ncbi:hypothetical protein DPEC_G00283380 [Dallia pectoralis]|uniref:Uncharacterized protein n=2 Tax=Dallia pectoralis TaxID=75939 RepID=A0ACC2FJ72_DALPE|nr:hypothetical protein DPEC_G00283320 [Dallia pectoralis]KAJ7991396.1 hypothetical protein DPEC_G00283380 [Dallia pectoralis]